MRSLTPAMILALTGQDTGEVFVMLVTIDHAVLAEPLRFSSDPTERVSDTPLIYKTASRGDDFIFVPMEITLPDDADGAPQRAGVRVSNVGREQITLLRSVSTPASVTMELVVASDPDTVGMTLPVLDLTDASWDAAAVQLTLTIDALDKEPFPAGTFDPASFPALH
jgi:hypothetical protein